MRDRNVQDCDKQRKAILNISFKTNEPSVVEKMRLLERFSFSDTKIKFKQLFELTMVGWAASRLDNIFLFVYSKVVCFFKTGLIFTILNFATLKLGLTREKKARPLNKTDCPKLSEMVYHLFIVDNLPKEKNFI